MTDFCSKCGGITNGYGRLCNCPDVDKLKGLYERTIRAIEVNCPLFYALNVKDYVRAILADRDDMAARLQSDMSRAEYLDKVRVIQELRGDLNLLQAHLDNEAYKARIRKGKIQELLIDINTNNQTQGVGQ